MNNVFNRLLPGFCFIYRRHRERKPGRETCIPGNIPRHGEFAFGATVRRKANPFVVGKPKVFYYFYFESFSMCATHGRSIVTDVPMHISPRLKLIVPIQKTDGRSLCNTFVIVVICVGKLH